jgi:hypothetical protein
VTASVSRLEEKGTQDSMQRLTLSFIIAVVWGCLLLSVKVQAQSEGSYFVHLGEGFTTAPASGGIELNWRMFTVPALPEICASAPSPDRLMPREDHIEITPGELFSFRALNVLAVDGAGMPLQPVPIIVDIEVETPAIVTLVDGEAYKQTGRTDIENACCEALALQPGTFRLRIHTLCAALVGSTHKEKETIIHYRVKAQ